MNGNQPKRRKDKYNPYQIVEQDGHFYLSFTDGEGVTHCLEVDKPLYELFDGFELEDLSYLNEWDRHIEHSKLTEASLNKRALRQTDSIEDEVFQGLQSEQLHQAIVELPDVQRHRLELYFFEGYTYEQIAEMEGCTKMPVKRSIDRALAELRKRLSWQ